MERIIMKILALDTSSKNASVAIMEENVVLVELNNEEEKTHSQKLMPMIDEALQKTNLSLEDIQLICCGLGPRFFYRSSNWNCNRQGFCRCQKFNCSWCFFSRKFSLPSK